MNTLLFTKPLLSYSFSADLPQRSCSDIQSRKSIRTFDLYEKTCNQVDHLFLGDHFFIWEIVIILPASTDHCEVSTWGCVCFVNCNTPCKYKIWMSSSLRIPRLRWGLPFCPLSCPSKVAFPTVFNASCPFPAFPYYKGNWHSGPCPPCQLASA